MNSHKKAQNSQNDFAYFAPFCGYRSLIMLAARLHGPADIRVEEVSHPGAPQPGEVLLRVATTGVCGSDLHPYESGTIGDTMLGAPLILGHEFSGVIEDVGDGVNFQIGTRVAVDPAWTCGACRECLKGHPNLCRQQRFCGLYPNHGSLCQWMRVPARFCHAVPDSLSDEEAALLEPLGVALHATDLARIRLDDSVAIIGAGPIGLCALQLAKLAGAGTVYIEERLEWRRALAQKLGALPLPQKAEVDVAIECAWAAESAQLAVDITRPGGTVVLVGIPLEDTLELKHSALRRKGLTLLMCRRMKHVYGRTLALVESGRVDVKCMITHSFPLSQAAEAFRMNAAYEDNVVKVMIES
jgi:L-iditol 2-dehydrogenase